jgi:hypothetical protein
MMWGGEFPVTTRKTVKRLKIIQKLSIDVVVTTTGKQIRGKVNFLANWHFPEIRTARD